MSVGVGSAAVPGTVTVRAVRTRRERARFVGLPYRLHRSDPHWTPPLRRDVHKLIDPKKNPYFEHAEAELFLAHRNGSLVGRVAATVNHAHEAAWKDGAGFFGFFESEDDPEVAQALLEAAAEWCRARGCTRLRGPASFSTNDECGLLVEGFDTPPTILTPHNPPYYLALIESAGFAKCKDLLLYESDTSRVPERFMRTARRRAERSGVTIRSLDVKRFDEEVELLKRMYNGAWERNWGFVPLSEAELEHMARDLRPLVIPEMVAFAECKGETIGVFVALPDFNVALRANPGGRLFPGIVRVLLAARNIRRARVLLLGVLEEYRNTGADALLMEHAWGLSAAKGFHWSEAGWVLEDNASMCNGLERMGFRAYRTLRMLERTL